jgi:hypothetical protein
MHRSQYLLSEEEQEGAGGAASVTLREKLAKDLHGSSANTASSSVKEKLVGTSVYSMLIGRLFGSFLG